MKGRNNIILTCMKMEAEYKGNIKETITNFLLKYLYLIVSINYGFRIGPKTNILELNDSQNKTKIMSNKKILKNLGGKIYINHDRTRNERKIERIIRQEELNESY